MKLFFWIFIFFFPGTAGWRSRQLSIQPGASITIPCHYEKHYTQNKKYWCYDAGSAFNFCVIKAYANNTAGTVTVTDYPAQTLFTVTMRDLQTGDTGSYWCAVEIKGSDVNEQFYITVKSVPDVGVVKSSVRSQVGGSVMVQCLYSDRFQDYQKQWCRSKNLCYAEGRTNISQNSAVQINNDWSRRSFSVEMSGLQKSDAGWYWCRIGNQEVPVHLGVDDTLSDSQIVVVCLTVLLLLILLTAVATWFLRKRQATSEQRNVKAKEEKSGCEGNTADAELAYSSVLFKKNKKKSKQRNPENQSHSAPEDPVIYSTLA